jgi:hypothetical protein
VIDHFFQLEHRRLRETYQPHSIVRHEQRLMRALYTRRETMRKTHIATYAEYSPTGRRVATGFIYSADEIPPLREKFETVGQPFHMRWRNEECRATSLSE